MDPLHVVTAIANPIRWQSRARLCRVRPGRRTATNRFGGLSLESAQAALFSVYTASVPGPRNAGVIHSLGARRVIRLWRMFRL